MKKSVIKCLFPLFVTIIVISCASIDQSYATLDPDDTVTRHILDDNFREYANKTALNHYNLAVFHMERGNFNEAEKQYKLALEVDAEFMEGINNLAYLYTLEGRYSEAKLLCDKSLSLYENNRVALVNLGLVYSETQDFESALNVYQRLIKNHPEYAEGFYGYSRILILVDRPNEALGYLEEAAYLYHRMKVIS